MSVLYVKKLEIKKLWGKRDFSLEFFDDVNILIGPNASGKTTILTLLSSILTPDIPNLNEIEFEKVNIVLQTFVENNSFKIFVKPTEDGYQFVVDGEEFEIPLESQKLLIPRRQRQLNLVTKNLSNALEDLINIVWLPVSRRLPITGEEEEKYLHELRSTRYMHLKRRLGLESVDLRLQELLKELSRYKLRLDSQLSERYQEFEKRVLQMILYSKEHDQISSFKFEELSDEDKKQLLQAFEVAGLMDPQMKERIDTHFKVAAQARKRLDQRSSDTSSKSKKVIPLTDVFVIPLIRRTKAIIDYAKELNEDRKKLFQPLRDYEERVNSFFEGKRIEVREDGELTIKLLDSNQNLEPEMLSSGEKQILILLTQALLSEGKSVVYMADEPELSLHVVWQEKLLSSLKELGGRIQIILATHSPDIVGDFTENVIDLGKME